MSDQVSDQNDGVSDTSTKPNEVSYESFQRLLGQHKKSKAEMELLVSKLSEFESEKQRIEEEKQRQEGNWKSLVESKETRLKSIEDENKALKQEAARYKKTLDDAVKLNAFQNKLGGRLKKSEYLNFVDTEKIPVDPDTGLVDDKAVEHYATEFSTKYKELIAFEKAGQLPNGAAAPATALSYESWARLPLSEKKNRLKDVIKEKK